MPKGGKKTSLYKYLGIAFLCFICIYGILIWKYATNKYFIEDFSEERKGAIKKFNWWKEDETETTPLFDILFKKHAHKFDEIHIYSVFGELKQHKKENTLRIQYSGESSFNDPELFHINIIPGDHSHKNVVNIPYMLTPILHRNVDLSIYTRKRRMQQPKTEFCLFAVSNSNNKDRNNFFHELSKYKKVDSCGKIFNNLGYSCPGNDHLSPEYLDFISKYKFMICFENTSLKHYLTEKLFNAYSNGTIPIYWGCPNVDEFVNLSSILYLKPDYRENDVKKLVKEIIALDNDDELYRKKYESIFFKDGRIPDMFNKDIIQTKIDTILSNSGL